MSSAITYRIAVRLEPRRTATRPESHGHEALIALPQDSNRKALIIFRTFRRVLSTKTWRIFRWMIKK